MKVYNTVVQNPLFLANGLRFKVNEETGQKTMRNHFADSTVPGMCDRDGRVQYR